MKNFGNLLLIAGIGLIAFSGWVWYQSSIDARTLVELTWAVPQGAQVGQETPAPIMVKNLSNGEAKIVGLNHC
jgi:hypothetical protein